MQPPFLPGTILQNRYRLLSILGQGGFGCTYLGEDVGRFNERCAVKEFIPSQVGDNALGKSRELFQREAQTLYQINHPQIPQFRATFEEGQRLFIVQDYVEGKTYRDLLTERKHTGMAFSEPDVQRLIRQLLPVLAHIHAKGLIHRDIAPDNIILRQADQTPVLIDFGVVKAIATQVQLQTGYGSTTVGKLGFAPPEQMQTGRAYPNSDLYALAVTSIVLLTGREPQELYDDVTTTWFWQRYVTVHPTLAAVINKLLSYRPSDRYQSVSEVAQALQPLFGGTNALPPPPTSPVVPTASPKGSGVPPAPPLPLGATPVQPGTNLSQMRTVAVGRRPITNPTGMAASSAQPQNRPRHTTPVVAPSPTRSGAWENPWAVIGMGLGLAVITGVASWAVVTALMNEGSSDIGAQPSPIPTETVTPTPTPTPTPSPTPTPTPSEPVIFDQSIGLAAGATTDLRGNLQGNQWINYSFALDGDDTLNARLEGDGIVMSVLGPDQRPVDSLADTALDWQGQVRQSGTYTVQVRPLDEFGQVNYTLQLRRDRPEPEPSPEPEPIPEPSPENSGNGSEDDSGDDSEGNSDDDLTLREENVRVRSGERIEVSDQVNPTTVRRYRVRLRQGETLSADLIQGDAFMMLRAPDGRVIDNSQVEANRNGHYTVDIYADRVVNFVLGLRVR
ncbi:MAG: serine/threonine protein kinase [Kaiparowitsia implicata GSE-PSE-MK54-09C]|jgi:serine/threonine-protein kinase|nr:serine/threonine protein kinase [Kaiparowitsia implicata GSE-PSE-MK54-09C]